MTYILHIILWVVSHLPLRVLYVFADLIYFPVSRFYRRQVVLSNLQRCFPDKDENERRAIAKRFYHTFCDYLVEDIKSYSMSRSEMMRRVTFSAEGLHTVQELLADGRKDFVFAMMGHFGNWEWLASVAYWLPTVHCAQLYTPLSSKVMGNIMLRMRERYGGQCISRMNVARRLLELKRDGRKTIVAFIADQLPQWNSIHHFADFMGQPTAVFTGGEALAKKLDVGVVYADISRPRRGYYHCHLRLLTDSPGLLAEYEMTDIFMHMLQDNIRQHPELWLWTHKRWRRSYEEWLQRTAAERNNS